MGIETTFTRAQIRGAILRAADRIEREPGSYDFQQIGMPPEGGCGMPYCMFGWIGFELGSKQDLSHRVATEIAGGDPRNNYILNDAANEMYKFAGQVAPDFQRNALEAARAMRAWADARFPAEKLDKAYIAFRSTLSQTMEAT
jgi:hypothetical protein